MSRLFLIPQTADPERRPGLRAALPVRLRLIALMLGVTIGVVIAWLFEVHARFCG